MLDLPQIQQYDQCTAWEVVFGRQPTSSSTIVSTNDDGTTTCHSSSHNTSWSLFQDRSKGNGISNNNNNNTNTNSHLTASKLESIRHAFFTEAIRCMSTDDVVRFQQLHQAGMPIHDENDPTEKSSSSSSLTKWCHDFHAHQCLQYIETTAPHDSPEANTGSDHPDMNGHNDDNHKNHNDTHGTTIVGRKLPMFSEGLVSLQNRYEELDALCRSLSACLDNVAEEVSVGAGLLLSSNGSGGAQALASHVRTVKHQREQLLDEYERYQETYQNSLDELLYYIQQYNIKYKNTLNGTYPAEIRVDDIDDWWQENIKTLRRGVNLTKPVSETLDGSTNAASPGTMDDTVNDNNNNDEQRVKEQHMITQIMILETKIRRIRATISDLSDDNQRNQDEIERRQLMVGLQYIRTLRNEIRDVEYQIYELKQYDIDCRNKIRTIQNHLSLSTVPNRPPEKSNTVTTTGSSDLNDKRLVVSSEPITVQNGKETRVVNSMVMDQLELDDHELQPTEKRPITASNPSKFQHNTNDDENDTTRRDYTTTMVVHGPTRGFLSLNLWQILLRIIGMGGGGGGRNGGTNYSSNNSTMIQSTASAVNPNNRSDTSSSTSRPVIII